MKMLRHENLPGNNCQQEAVLQETDLVFDTGDNENS